MSTEQFRHVSEPFVVVFPGAWKQSVIAASRSSGISIHEEASPACRTSTKETFSRSSNHPMADAGKKRRGWRTAVSQHGRHGNRVTVLVGDGADAVYVGAVFDSKRGFNRCGAIGR